MRLASRAGALRAWPAAAAQAFFSINLASVANRSVDSAKSDFALADWFTSETLTVNDLPFKALLSGNVLLGTSGAQDEAELKVPLSGRASEAYLLTLARLTGNEEPVYFMGYLPVDEPFNKMENIDRICVTIRYADGTEQRALPARVGTDRWGVASGLQVLTVQIDPARELSELVLYKGSPQAELGLAALTLNTSTGRRFESRWSVKSVPATKALSPSWPDVKPSATLSGTRLTLSNRYLEADFDLAHGALPTRLLHRALGVNCLSASPLPLFGIGVGGNEIDVSKFNYTSATRLGSEAGYQVTYACNDPALEVAVHLGVGDRPAIDCRLSVRNTGTAAVRVDPIGPRLTSILVGPASAMWFMYPASESTWSDAEKDLSQWYGGSFMPLQFMDAYNPLLGGGVGLQVRDVDCLEKMYHMAKTSAGVSMRLVYQQRELAPLEIYALAPAQVQVHTGDWRAAFDDYKAWVATWHKPICPRPQWMREVFNFRQGFMYIDYFGTMVDPKTGEYKFGEYIDESNEAFGGGEYLHIFDWGMAGPYGRTYGRVGDYDPGDYYSTGYHLPLGWAGFQNAVKGVRDRGLRVGYYIEGYLLNETGRLGQRYAKPWAQIGTDGNEVRWPGSPEVGICPAIKPWTEIQAETYARMVQRMDADGMYIDQFALNGPIRWCYSKEHGHPVPSNSLKAEAEATRSFRTAIVAVKKDVMLYTEYSPTDVVSQYQDGSFSYSMQRQRKLEPLAPLKIFRYAFPDFKNFEILNCDSPTGTWATGVRWTCWNGEGLWLQGWATKWFAPQTRRAIQECHRVLRDHRDAFAGTQAETLVPTLAAGLFANKFTGAKETAYTVYNGRNETFSGESLAVPCKPGMKFLDAFSGRKLEPAIRNGQAIVTLTLNPQGVGCVVVTSSEPKTMARAAWMVRLCFACKEESAAP